MLPWLAHGHISPFLELAKKLSSRNFHFYICSTPVNLNSIKPRITAKYSQSIELVELHLPSLPDLPPNYHTTNGLPPNLMVTLKNAYEMSIPNFCNILTTLGPNLVIYDFNQPWAADAAASRNIPAVQFVTMGGAIMSFGLHMLQQRKEEFPFKEIFIPEYWKPKMMKMTEKPSADVVQDMERFLQALKKSCKLILIKSCIAIEGKYLNHLSNLSEKKMVPVGPLVQDEVVSCLEDDKDKEIMKWLDKKETASVVFVSFGSEYFLSKEEIDDVAKGLELSNANFIWAIRFPMGQKSNLEEVLPKGFLERVGDRGLVVEGWAPQLKILMHENTGGFVSHCGWSSIMEGMKYGVPMIAMPMHIDQPLNARLIEAVGVGEEPARDKDGKLQGEEIAKVIKKIVLEESGESIRRKAKEVSEKLKANGDEEIDGVVEELIELCKKKD